jgi:hypothetical protein
LVRSVGGSVHVRIIHVHLSFKAGTRRIKDQPGQEVSLKDFERRRMDFEGFLSGFEAGEMEFESVRINFEPRKINFKTV